MMIPTKPDGSTNLHGKLHGPNKPGARMTRRALLGVLPAISAAPVFLYGVGETRPGEAQAEDNRPTYTTTPHIEAFYHRSRF